MHQAIAEKREQLIAECRRLRVNRLDVFGSAVPGDNFDQVCSDADFLVAFRPDAEAEFYLDLEEAFERILGRKVDLIDRRAVETSRNYIRRRSILESAEPIYVA